MVLNQLATRSAFSFLLTQQRGERSPAVAPFHYRTVFLSDFEMVV